MILLAGLPLVVLIPLAALWVLLRLIRLAAIAMLAVAVLAGRVLLAILVGPHAWVRGRLRA